MSELCTPRTNFPAEANCMAIWHKEFTNNMEKAKKYCSGLYEICLIMWL